MFNFNEILKKIKHKTHREIATELFPGVKFPMSTLNRIANGTSLLDTDQLKRLADLVGVSVAELFGNEWKGVCPENPNEIVMTNKDFKAIYNADTGLTRMFYKHSIFSEVFIVKKTTTLNEYISKLNNLISKAHE